MYQGKLTEDQQRFVRENLEAGESVRGAADSLGYPYGQVRGYAEHLAKQDTPLPDDGRKKVLFFDIETAPLLSFIWHPITNYVSHIQQAADTFMLTWAAKWWGQDNMLADSLSGKEALAQNDSRIVRSLADLVAEADIVVAHNGDKFDMPRLNARLLAMRQTPMGPYQTIDTLKLAKRNFNLPYYKLDYIAEFLGLGKKIKTDFDLWIDVYHGDEAAISEMLEYNINDVVLLEQVFEAMIPYVTRLTRLFRATMPNEVKCAYCGHDQFTKRGEDWYETQASTFQKYQCKKCGKYARARVSEKNRLAYHPL